MERDAEYRASSDRMLQVLERLREIEEVKRSVPVGTTEFIELAREAEDLGRTVFRWTQLQRQLAELSPQRVAAGQLSGLPLAALAARRIERVLAEWREAEFRFREADPGSPDAERAAADMERLREEYRSTHERVMRAAEAGEERS